MEWEAFMMENKTTFRGIQGIPFWLIVSVFVFCGGLLLNSYVNAESEQSQAAQTVFQLVKNQQTAEINLQQLKDEFAFGTATIKLHLDSLGKVSGAPEIDLNAERRGKETFAQRLADIMKTWQFTPGVKGTFFVTVAIPSDSETREGKVPVISVDLTHLELPEDNGVTIGFQKRQQINLVAQQGFFDNIFLTGTPAKVKIDFEKGFGTTVGQVFVKLGPFFQFLFGFVFIVFVFAIIHTVRTINKKWVPDSRKWWHFKWLIPNSKELVKNPEAKKVESMWIQAIKNTQFGRDLLHEYELDSEIDNIRAKVETAQNHQAIKKIIETDLSALLSPEFMYVENGDFEDDSFEMVKSRVLNNLKEQLQSGENIAKIAAKIQKVEKCNSLEEIEKVIPTDVTESLFAEKTREEKPIEVLRQNVLQVIDTLKSLSQDLNGNGHSNGGAGNAGKISDKKEKDYEKFLWEFLGKPRINESLQICAKHKSRYPLFSIFESGLLNHLTNKNEWWTSQEIDRSIDRTAAVKFEERRGPLDWLWAIGSLSPMFGLFGTVWGISQAFGKIKGVTDTRLLMQKLAGDINVALATTIVGLILGVLAFIAYYYFKYVLDNDAIQIEKFFTDITNNA